MVARLQTSAEIPKQLPASFCRFDPGRFSIWKVEALVLNLRLLTIQNCEKVSRHRRDPPREGITVRVGLSFSMGGVEFQRGLCRILYTNSVLFAMVEPDRALDCGDTSPTSVEQAAITVNSRTLI